MDRPSMIFGQRAVRLSASHPDADGRHRAEVELEDGRLLIGYGADLESAFADAARRRSIKLVK